ncbi:putative pectinesterase/pectinesterase inhibitor 28 isoform X1 [Momordica charantia]|uniref:Pectinesterase n=1 Tax=Momordica charantia TaxID=3673 RepID=A0A6J1C9H6_MOMCH|nr:putative pectinesterase/pectinesterase inhibitor 28 isoform X1 [Momordica charantia]
MSGDDGGKKTIAIVSVCALVVVAMVVAVVVTNSKSAAPSGGEITTSTKAIKAICQPTDYKEICEESLTKEGVTSTDPKELVKSAFKIATDYVNGAIQNSTTLKELAKDPRANQALQNCRELLEFAIDDIKESFERIGTFQMGEVKTFVEDLKVWLSGAMTYEDTCLDGFENTTGEAGEKMKQFLKSSQQLTSNGLAMVTELSKTLGDLQLPTLGRRLMGEDDIPEWVSDTNRRLLQAGPPAVKPNVVVAQDGSGKYKTINEALAEIPKKSNITFVIHVKAGIYKETVVITKAMTHVTMYGDGPTKTVVTGSLNYIDGVQTFKTATFAAIGANFFARDMGFENSAGPTKHQAVALRVQSDRSIFYNCRMDGYQDTLYAQTHRQFYRDCVITGTIDFVFGNSAAVFQNCQLVVRKPMDNQQCIVTAQGRLEEREPTALVFQSCHFTSDPAYYPHRAVNKAYLGRPWKAYSRTIIMQSQIDDLIQPEGWLPWMGTFGLDTLFYAELQNTGPGSDKSKRVKWAGIKEITPEQALAFTPKPFIDGDAWIKDKRLPYSSNMMLERSRTPVQ